ncbi:hypothetical protein N7478_004453 [Penicillium angulare]|uniref:uncharacterized protein n=1 Tax=Penicillium angulare TaxID=116970 RepID=UPI0025412D4C|nr:uncharacterized protein N7478_004453 [Penicillium angulare]KAJ5279081.1 hypothetical protein N7478_004453 [Penicillium angulare]
MSYISRDDASQAFLFQVTPNLASPEAWKARPKDHGSFLEQDDAQAEHTEPGLQWDFASREWKERYQKRQPKWDFEKTGTPPIMPRLNVVWQKQTIDPHLGVEMIQHQKTQTR